MKLKWLGLTFLLAWAPNFLANCGATELPVQIDRAGRLSGVLLLAKNSSVRTPVVLLVPGSGPTDRDGNAPNARSDSLLLLAKALSEEGVASLRFDKRGVGGSAISGFDEASLRFETYVDDTAAWLAFLKADKRFDKILVAGHSEGALIAALAAGLEPVQGVVSIAGVSKPADEVIKVQLSGRLPADLYAQSDHILRQLKSGKSVPVVPTALLALYRPSVQRYLASWFAYDPIKVFSAIRVPILILQGDSDLQVPSAAAAELARASVNGVMKIIPSMNHVLKNVSGELGDQLASYNDPRLPVSPALVQSISNFALQL